MEEHNGFEYVGDVPAVYKGVANLIIYHHLYMRRGVDRLFFAIETEYGLEAIADGKDKYICLENGRNSQFHYNAENDRICALIPEYEM